MAASGVIFIDENRLFLRIAARLLAIYNCADLTITATHASWEEAEAALAPPYPRAVLLGLGARGLIEPELIRAIKARLPQAALIVLGHLDEPAYHEAALKAGAHAFLPKTELLTALAPIIHRLDGLAAGPERDLVRP